MTLDGNANNCANCGEPLNEDGTKHHNGITFCAFVTADIRWNDWRTAKQNPSSK